MQASNRKFISDEDPDKFGTSFWNYFDFYRSFDCTYNEFNGKARTLGASVGRIFYRWSGSLDGFLLHCDMSSHNNLEWNI